jgi:hypothetical protein
VKEKTISAWLKKEILKDQNIQVWGRSLSRRLPLGEEFSFDTGAGADYDIVLCISQLNLSARGVSSRLKLAAAIADLAGGEYRL